MNQYAKKAAFPPPGPASTLFGVLSVLALVPALIEHGGFALLLGLVVCFLLEAFPVFGSTLARGLAGCGAEVIAADTLVSPEKESAVRLAHALPAPGIVDYIELSEGPSLVQLEAPKKFHGKSIRDLDVRNLYNVNIVAIKRRIDDGTVEDGGPTVREELMDIPRPDYVIESTDILVLIGEDKDIGRLAI